MKKEFRAAILLDVESHIFMVNNGENGFSFPEVPIDADQNVISATMEAFRAKTGIIPQNLQHLGSVICDISDDHQEYILLFKASSSLGEISKYQDEFVWLKRKKFDRLELTPKMEIYMNIFSGRYFECRMSYIDNFVPNYREPLNICRIERLQIPECVNVIRESFMTVASEFGLTKENASRYTAFATTEGFLNWQIEKEKRHMFAYYEDRKIVGYFSIAFFKNGECELNNLCVLPEYRGDGIGTKLLEYSFKVAMENKCSSMNIGLINDAAVLKHWFYSKGFEQIKIEKYDFFPFYYAYMKKRFEYED